MSERDPLRMRDYTKFDTMPTEELREFLRADVLLPEDEAPDLDEILYVTDVLARREQTQADGKPSDVEAAWQSFNAHYWPETDDGTSLYEDEPAPRPEKFKWSRQPRALRWAAGIAAMIAVLYVGSLTARAFGLDVWSSVAHWTRETFSLAPPVERPDNAIAPQLQQLQLLMQEHDIFDVYLPSYLPEGFAAREVNCSDRGGYASFSCSLSNGEQEILLKYFVFLSDEARPNMMYEKDDPDPEVYEAGGVTHYLMTNYGQYGAVWFVNRMECSIWGNISHDEMIKIIDSIY